MSMKFKQVYAIMFCSFVAGCNAPDKTPLVFVQSQTLGITANASGSTATPELTLGYRDLDVALVPVGAENNGMANKNSDAYSVIGQFNAGVTSGTAPQANLGKFFATGLAARDVALGFKGQLQK
jgi:hypothetical protein